MSTTDINKAYVPKRFKSLRDAILQHGFEIPSYQPPPEEVNDWAIAYLKQSDKQAFDTLYNAIQDIGDITQRAIRDGEPGYKSALHEIMKTCRGVE